MYENIGGKIKGLAKFVFIADAIAAVITGIILMAQDADMVGVGFLVILGGTLLAWVSTWLLYGFGQLIENSDIIAQEYNRKNEKHDKEVAKKNEQKQIQRRKEATAKLGNSNVDDDEFIDVTCPGCKAELSFTKGQLQDPEGATCPFCDAGISL